MDGDNRLDVASQMAVDDPDMNSTIDRLANGSATTDGETTLGRKRKSRDDSAESDSLELASARGGVKKAKLADGDEKGAIARTSSNREESHLPREVWCHIFTFCPPKSLGNLLVVNKLFNISLDPASTVQDGGLGAQHTSSSLEPNAIWQASRRLFWPQMPAPLRSKTELDMWRLACSSRCQECGKRCAQGKTAPPDPRRPGPGPDGVAAVWAFGRHTCGPCLLKNSVKEIDLLLSSSVPSAIMAALPFVFVTPDLNVFSATTLEQGQLPAGLQVTKLFSSSDIEALKQEFLQVKDMGQGTVSEWLKGLDGRGSAMQHDASKWEKWESSGGTDKMRAQLYPGYVRKPLVSLPQKPPTAPIPVVIPSFPITPISRQPPNPYGRQERSADEVAALKAARKAEIERLALLLDPPLTADVLHHIPSFQAATHIVTPLTDQAWELLKPRLLAQRADAERAAESERNADSHMAQEAQISPHLETTLASTKEARDRIEKLWEDVQAPLRVQICGYADQVIRDSWGKGKMVTKENCSRFAVEVLLHIRKCFYGEVAREANAAKAAGKKPLGDPPEGPFTQKLTLENMKWIFDNKIKPFTEPLRKEPFYCSVCEGSMKPFGFEGVIQHYAAKHTSVLSRGNMVVHWRAEWPEHPPFSATTRPAKSSFQPNVPTPFPIGGGVPPPPGYNYPPPPGTPVAAPPPVYPPAMGAMGYGHTPPAFNEYYQSPPVPPQMQQPYQMPPPGPPFNSQPWFEQQPPYADAPAHYSGYQPPGVPYHPPAAEPTHVYMVPQGGQFDFQHSPHPANNALGPYVPPPPPSFQNFYQSKVVDIARNSRDVWRLLGDIKDLAGSVRVFVTIHHLVKRFQSRFYETPTLAMFIDGLSNNKEMRPVRNINGLVCKTCHIGLSNAASVEGDKKFFSLPQLANHFQSRHVEPMQNVHAQNKAALPDWVLDMVLLPENAAIAGVASAVNETQKALLSTTPGPVSEHGRSTDGDGGRQSSSQGSRPARGQNVGKNAKKETRRSRRWKLQGGHESGAQGAKNFNAGGKKGRGEERGARGMRATLQAAPASGRSSTKPERGVAACPSQQSGGNRTAVPAAANGDQELDIMAALESRLEQRPLPQFEGHQQARAAPTSQESREPGMAADLRKYAPGPYSRQSDREALLLQDSRYQAPGEERELSGRQFDGAYYTRPAPVERREDAQQTQPGYVELLPRHALEEERFAPPPRQLDDRTHRALPPTPTETDYHRYPEEVRMARAPPVETYEIVHVIDGDREYYYRRPMRREPEPPRYVYEERRVVRDAGVYPPSAHEPGVVYAPVSRGGVVWSGGQRGQRRAEQGFYEEYDPRFPAA
ncbi:hypothetical protein N0V88_004515 [Collariella sp. IMI 366227]|nr:hypothetical protein N0V88_004515 [Collariella sp. IMI 366227]